MTPVSSNASLLVLCTRHSWRGQATGVPVADIDPEEVFVETAHYGWGILMNTDGSLLWQTEEADSVSTFFRSSAKPFQASLLLGYDAENALTSEELAIASGSHSGTKQHVACVNKLLSRLKKTDNQSLWCGPQAPVDTQAAQALLQSQEQPTPLHNNCSGKHAAMLWLCEQAGWNTQTYWQPEHPLQQAILNLLSDYGGISKPDIKIGLDGCGIPTFYLPLTTMATLYRSLVSEETFSPIVKAMIQHPELVSGFGRIDWAIMTVSQGNLISKVGADGLICIANRSTKQSLVLKLADGNQAIRDHLILHYLEQLGWLTKGQCLSDPCQPFYETVRYNTLRQPVGEIQHCLQPALP